MKHKLLMLALFSLAAVAVQAVPDLKNPALTPVKFETAPNHAPLKLIEKGKLNFAIVYDKNNRDRAFTSSVERAALLLGEAVEKCTGIKPVILGLHESDKAERHRYKIYLGYNDITKKLGAAPFKGPKQGYQLFTCPEGVVIAGYDSALLDKGKNIPAWSLGKFCGGLCGAPAILPNAFLAAAGISPANMVRFSRRLQS